MSKRKVPKYLATMADRYKAKPAPEEMRKTIQRAQASGWTQGELAALFGTHQQAISRWAQPDPVEVEPTDAEEVSP